MCARVCVGECEATSQWPCRRTSADDNADGDGIKRVKSDAMCVRKRAKVLKWSTCVLARRHLCACVCVCLLVLPVGVFVCVGRPYLLAHVCVG